MSGKPRGVEIRKPTSIWNRTVKFDLKPLFKSLGKAATHTATMKFDELGNDAIEFSSSLGLETPIEELAYTLIRRALFDALKSLTNESISHIDAECLHKNDLGELLLANLSGTTIKFDKYFFQHPSRQEYIEKISKYYAQWLCDQGVQPKSAENISARLPSYFVFSLADEWKRNSAAYSRLLEQEGTPFSNAEFALKGWGHYFAFLQKRVSENIFDEPFSLSQIYVPLNAYYVDHSSKVGGASEFRMSEKRICVALDTELKSWLVAKSKSKSDPIRVISGGPGSGKSSFARMFCSEVAQIGLAKPIYIPLHLIDPTRDILSEVDRFIREEGLLGFNPLDPDRQEDGILLVFDGLDELASLGKASAKVARDFVQAVERMVERRNLGANPISVLISGRELVIQENETEFRRPRQILNILPYFITDDKDMYGDQKSIIDIDLRQVWWKKYGALTGANFSGLPDQLRLEEIDEITSQPLLNYLVALSYQRGELDFTRKLNLNSVYEDLVAAVHERGYERSRTYRPIRHIALKDFVRVLEEVGLAAWHGGDGRSTSVGEIMIHCRQSGLETLLKSLTEDAQEGVTKLLAAFFFRRNGESVGDDATFVFTHKSFGEYLTAMRLVRGLERIVVERQRRKENADDGFDIGDAWVHWVRLAGPAPMTEYIQLFLRRQISVLEPGKLANWQSTIAELVGVAMDELVPIERIGNITFAKSSGYYVNASTALFIALNAASIALQSPAKISFSLETSFGTFLRRVCPQRAGAQSPVIFSALSYIDLSGQCLDMADFYGADLSYTIWHRCRIHFATFSNSVLVGADFSNSILNWSRFDGSVIRDTKFNAAKMQEVRFSSSLSLGNLLTNVDFRFSDLRHAFFVGVELVGCDFSNSIVSASTLYKARRVEACRVDGAVVGDFEKSFIQWAIRSRSKGGLKGQFRISPLDQIEKLAFENFLSSGEESVGQLDNEV